MVCQIASDLLNPDSGNAVGRQDPLGGLGTGETAIGMNFGITVEGRFYRGTCPERKENTGQNQNQIGNVETISVSAVTIIHKDDLLIFSGESGKIYIDENMGNVSVSIVFSYYILSIPDTQEAWVGELLRNCKFCVTIRKTCAFAQV